MLREENWRRKNEIDIGGKCCNMYSFLLSMLNYLNSKVLTVIFSFSLIKKIMDFILYSATLVLCGDDFNIAFETRNLNSVWISQSWVCIQLAWNPDPVKSMAEFPLTSKTVGFHTRSPFSFFFSLSALANGISFPRWTS